MRFPVQDFVCGDLSSRSVQLKALGDVWVTFEQVWNTVFQEWLFMFSLYQGTARKKIIETYNTRCYFHRSCIEQCCKGDYLGHKPRLYTPASLQVHPHALMSLLGHHTVKKNSDLKISFLILRFMSNNIEVMYLMAIASSLLFSLQHTNLSVGAVIKRWFFVIYIL